MTYLHPLVAALSKGGTAHPWRTSLVEAKDNLLLRPLTQTETHPTEYFLSSRSIFEGVGVSTFSHNSYVGLSYAL